VGSNPTLPDLFFLMTFLLTRFPLPTSIRTGRRAKDNAGRNSTGRITVRHRGGGHKRSLRHLD
jgi:hypothetical protein